MEDSTKTPSLRCHHCEGPLSKQMETSRWTISPLIRDSFSMIGSAVGGVASAFYGFNHSNYSSFLMFIGLQLTTYLDFIYTHD
ncbi:hypothetical protein GIB67_037731 [Kingdonia uniflora]|uniref:Uncharacterized protein n=1 Tax=Kingdonia uniflora TaxID=39325 RepID=A0A7J7LUT7_9MAGN|nr:hypothetical protein GIB67_037731 [Kingdonia uniflora]